MSMFRSLSLFSGVIALSFHSLAVADSSEPAKCNPSDPMEAAHIYGTNGTHNECGVNVYERKPGEPTDPKFPEYWSSTWNMYRVFKGYEAFPPPYADPPANLKEGLHYEKSWGATYYDSTFKPADGDGEGAMMEFYADRCLPIFESANDFTCSFTSLGNKAYFMKWDKPTGQPTSCCYFSKYNHPPRRDFIKHIPYSEGASRNLNDQVQAYELWVPGPHGDPILFAYSFWKDARPDPANRNLSYRHPQSFYFSGETTSPPNAPIVSQNYTSFTATRPDPANTWDLVGKSCGPQIPWCCLFEGQCASADKGDSDGNQLKSSAPPVKNTNWSNLEFSQ